MALILMGTLQHMVRNADAVAALRAARDALRPGGLLLLEMAHPCKDYATDIHTPTHPYTPILLRPASAPARFGSSTRFAT
jgi:hypothetical protein